MRSTLIAPTEYGHSLLHVKQALLSFDKVKLLEPADRQIYPENAGALAWGMPAFLSVPISRALGKTSSHDDRFSRLMDDLKPAVNAGIVETISTYDQSETNKLTIGNIPLGGYPLNVNSVHHCYRSLASDDTYLRTAIDADLSRHIKSSNDLETLCPVGSADGSFNDGPALPLIGSTSEFLDENYREPFTRAARARIATVVKMIGVCYEKDLVPTFYEDGFVGLIDAISDSTRMAIDCADDPMWARRNMALDIAYREFLDDEALDRLDIKDVLRLRTKAFGKFNANKTRLLGEISRVLSSSRDMNTADMRRMLEDRFHDFRTKIEKIEEERAALGWRVSIEFSKAIAGSVGGANLSNFAPSALQTITTPVALVSTIAFAVAYLLKRGGDFLPDARIMLQREKALDKLPEMAVYRHYKTYR